MEGYTVFLDWKNKYCLNVFTTQDNLQIQCNTYQITNSIFKNRTRTKFFFLIWYGDTKDSEQPK